MKCLIVLFFLPLCFVCTAQTNTDSLWKLWKNESIEDSIRFSAYYELIFKGYMNYKPDSAFVLAQAMYDAAEKIGFKSRMVDAMKLMASSHYLKSNYTSAMDINLEALELAREFSYKKGEADLLHNIGMIQYRHGNYSDGYINIKSSLVLHEEIRDYAGTASNLTNIGNIYAEQGDYSKGLKYYKLGLNMAEKIGFKIGIASGLYNVGYVYDLQKNYNNALEYYEKSLLAFEDINHQQGLFYAYGAIGKIFKRQGDYERAFEYYNRGLAVSETIHSSFGKAAFLRSIADLYVSQKDFNLAMDYYGQSLSLYQELADKRNISATQIEIGTAQLKQENTSIAISRCSTGLLIAEELNLIKEQALACECLYDAHKLVGNGIKALEYHEKMIAFNDSLKSEETSKKLQQMEFAKQVFADSLQKEEETLRMQMAHEKVLMKENRTRNLVAGAGLFILLIATGLWSRLRYIRRAKAVIEKEKDRSDNLLLNILPAEIAEELKTKGYADARDFEMVSILFTDFKEFTETAEKLSAQELVSEINTCFKTFDAICEKYQVEKIKTIGDSYMAAGGLPIPAKDSVRNTVRAALEMVDFMLERKSERKANGLIAFEMRAGIHTGPVVAGIVGVKKFQYDVWGDTVNTASRMESHGEVGRVNISQTTYELIKDDDLFSFETRGKLMVKGKGELQTYFVGVR